MKKGTVVRKTVIMDNAPFVEPRGTRVQAWRGDNTNETERQNFDPQDSKLSLFRLKFEHACLMDQHMATLLI